MAAFDYKQSYAWNEAIKLSQGVFALIETLPDTAKALGNQLARTAVMVPAKVAINLVNQEKADLGAVLKLAAAVELVDRIYPALDSGSIQNDLSALTDRLQSPSFTELMPPKVSAAPQEESVDSEEGEDETADAEEEIEEVEPEPETTNIKVQDN